MTTIKSINSTQTRKFQFKLKIQIIQIVKRLKTLHFTIKCKNSTSEHCVILSFETQLGNIHIDYDIKIESTCLKTRLTQHLDPKRTQIQTFSTNLQQTHLTLPFIHQDSKFKINQNLKNPPKLQSFIPNSTPRNPIPT